MVVVRSGLGAASLVPGLRQAVQSIDANLPLVDVRTMGERANRSIARARLTAIVLTAFAGVALGLAAIGIFGVLSWLVRLRTREIGIRIALGAARQSVVRLVVGRALALVAAGLVLGVASSLALTRVLRTLLFRVQPTDAATLAAVALLGVALTASYLPARRAASVDPVRALRSE